MTLTNRLSATFLAALALVLAGFSIALDLMASVHLHRAVDGRLDAALVILAALAEDEAGGLDWEHDERRALPGQEIGDDQVRWIVADARGAEVDRSWNFRDDEMPVDPGPRRLDRLGHPWRVARRIVRSSRTGQEPARGDRPSSLVLSAGLRLDPIEKDLWNLTAALAVLSVGLWIATALVGRWLCRRALAPLTRMATIARELGADEPGRRLPVASTGDELEDLGVAFNELLGRWHEALERQRRFSGDASHQLRTPLAALIGQVDVALRRERPPDEYRRTLARVRDQSDHLRRIVEALLFLARADAEAGLPTLDEIDLVAWTSDQIDRRLEDEGADALRWEEPPGGPVLVRVHPALLAQVLGNLLDNARDHGNPGGPVKVWVGREADWASLSVVDQGPGIDPADFPRLFEPFFRADGSRKTAPGGVGLGLAVARRIAIALGGGLAVESQPGQGTRFTLRLPVILASSRLVKPDAIIPTGGDSRDEEG